MCASVFARAKTDTRCPHWKDPRYLRGAYIMNHKKLLLTLTLCLCMLLGAVSLASADEEDAGSHSHALCYGYGTTCTDPAHSEGNHGSVTFATELRQDGNTLYIGADEWKYDSSWGGYMLGAGTYYLSTDLTLDHGIRIKNSGGEVTLCLNGNTVMCTSNGAVIQTPTGAYSANFTLCDCQPNGSVGEITHKTGATGSGVDLQRAANTPAHTFIMYNGCITGNTSTSGGGGVYVADSTTFTMYGGTITDNTANYGGGVYVAGGDTENKYFTMYGGSITENHANKSGGGIYSTSNNISIYGGGVTNNSVTKTGNAGGIYVSSSSGTLTVGGNVNISGNWQGDSKESGSKNNVYLDYYKDDFATIVIEKELTGENSSIGVTTATPVATTKDASVKIAAGKGTHAITDADKGRFTPDTGYCEVQKKNDGIYLTHVHSGGTATCTAKAKCGGCNAPYGDALGHDFVHHDAQPATCTAKGLEAYDTCSRCDYSTTKVEIPMADHTYSATEWKSDVDNHWHECSVCHTQIGKAAHEWQPATYTAPKTCVCGATQGEPLTRSYYYYAPSAAENKKDSPKAGDPGVLLYAGLALASLTGLACTAKKRH